MWLRSAAVGIVLLGAGACRADDQVWTELTSTGPTKSLAFSGCSPEECFGEAVTHVLGCSELSGTSYFEIIAPTDGDRMIATLTSLGWDEPGAELVVGGGSVAVALEALTLTRNAYAGGWDVLLTGFDFSDFFETLAQADLSQPIHIQVAGGAYPLNPNAEARDRLLALALLCRSNAT